MPRIVRKNRMFSFEPWIKIWASHLLVATPLSILTKTIRAHTQKTFKIRVNKWSKLHIYALAVRDFTKVVECHELSGKNQMFFFKPWIKIWPSLLLMGTPLSILDKSIRAHTHTLSNPGYKMIKILSLCACRSRLVECHELSGKNWMFSFEPGIKN